MVKMNSIKVRAEAKVPVASKQCPAVWLAFHTGLTQVFFPVLSPT